MTRHVLDRPRAPAETRTRRYLDADRREGLHPSTKALIRRDRGETEARVAAFLRIDRTADRAG